MQVEITVRIDGQEVVRQVETVDGTLEQMEENISQFTHEVARQTLQASVDRVTAPRPLFSAEGGEWRHRGYKPRTMMGLFGPVCIRRARYQCPKTGRMCVPLDEQLELSASEVTPALAKRVLHVAMHMSFAEVQTAVPLYFNVQLCDSVLDRLMQRAGTVAVEDARRETEALAALSAGEARERHVTQRRLAAAPKRLYVSSDGALYPSRNRQENGDGTRRIVYQEMKCGTVFWQTADDPWEKVVVAGREDVRTFGLRLWRTAVTCGMLEAEETLFISDAGGWCETVYETYFRDARRILDWYHLSEHVWAAARQLYSSDAAAAAQWAHAALAQLHDASGIGLMRFLTGELPRWEAQPTPAEALNGLLNYLRPRLAFTDYVAYRAGHYVIGSGMMESTCKQVVAARLKGSGRQWSEQGAMAMAHLITHRLNGTWDAFWASSPLRRTA